MVFFFINHQDDWSLLSSSVFVPLPLLPPFKSGGEQEKLLKIEKREKKSRLPLEGA